MRFIGFASSSERLRSKGNADYWPARVVVKQDRECRLEGLTQTSAGTVVGS